MSDIPETPTAAARVLIGWFAGGLAFECVHQFSDGHTVASAAYGIVAVAVAIFDYNLTRILAESPRLTQSLNRVAADARWWAAVAMISLLVIALSPYVEQVRWPFAWQLSSPVSGFTQQQVDEKVAAAVENLNSQLSQSNRQRDAALRDVEALRKQLQNSPPPVRPNYDEPRVFTMKTITELRGFYKDRTALQGSAFMADEIGKWINTEGAIQLIRPDGLVFLSDNDGIISCEFDASWKPKLSAFRTGETMKVVGKIGSVQIGVTPIYLQPCEIRN